MAYFSLKHKRSALYVVNMLSINNNNKQLLQSVLFNLRRKYSTLGKDDSLKKIRLTASP